MLGIISVQWNSDDKTVQFLDSIHDGLTQNLRLVIIDNNSCADHKQRLKNQLTKKYQPTALGLHAKISLIENSFNSGFARACNVGIKHILKSHAEWVWLLNNDTQIPSGSIQQLCDSLEQLEAGIYGTTILNNNGEPESAAGYKFNLWTTHFRALTKQDFQVSEISGLWYVSGASMLVHRRVFETCGLLDESTFLYFEELDFCQRATDQGFRLGWLPEVSVIHYGAGSSQSETIKPKIMYHETWSTLNYYFKHHKYLFPYILTVRTFFRIFMLFIKQRVNEIPPVFAALKDFVCGRNKDLADVRITQITHYE